MSQTSETSISAIAPRTSAPANGKLLHVCISAKKGIAKHEIPSANILVEHGMEGDAHSGDWHRQISLLAHVDIEFMRAKGLKLKPGAFGENLVIDGLDSDTLGIGSQLRIGPVLLELTQIGKVCHTRCAIYYSTGDCIMPRMGLFARVLEGGVVHPGMQVEVVSKISRAQTQAAIVTISDSCSSDDPAMAELLRNKLGARIAWTRTVPEQASAIADVVRDLCDRRVDLILMIGGSSTASHNVILEATRELIDRELPQLAHAIRVTSAEQTPDALRAPALAGVRRETLILHVPGSSVAATRSVEAVLPLLSNEIESLRSLTAQPEPQQPRLIKLNADANASSVVEVS